MSAGDILITGADGYLGSRIARAYLESTDLTVSLWCRASSPHQMAEKRERLGGLIGEFTGRAGLHAGDLRDSDPFADLDRRKIRAVIHSAAVTRFNVDEESAQAVNVEGTRKLLDFASRCPNLESFAYLSTIYASGLESGVIDEAPLLRVAAFANHYERSKWRAEQLILDRFSDLPWRILRVATVIAEDDGGRVIQHNAFHNTLKLFYYGLLSLAPGRPDVPLYFVTGDFVTTAALELLSKSEPGTIFHVCHAEHESPRLEELIDIAFEEFERDREFRSRRLLKPLFSDQQSFDLLVEGISGFGGAVVSQAVSSVAPFGRQLFVHKDVSNEKTRSLLSDYRAPDARLLVRRTCEYLRRTRWGRDPDSRMEQTQDG